MNNLQKITLKYNINAIIETLKSRIKTKSLTLTKIFSVKENRTQDFREYLKEKIKNCEKKIKDTNNEPELKIILNYLKKMLILENIVFNNKNINKFDIKKIITFNDLIENNNYIITDNLYEYILNKILNNDFEVKEAIQFVNKIITFNDLIENNNYIITDNLYVYILNKILNNDYEVEEAIQFVKQHLKLRNVQNNKNTFNKSTNAIYKEKLKKIEVNINTLKQVNKNLSKNLSNNYTI